MKQTARKLNTAIHNFLTLRASGINWAKQAAPGKWSNKQIIGHLIDSAHINLQRFVRCTYEDGFKLIYFQEEWVAAQHYNEADITELLKLWELVNLQIVRVLTNYPADRELAECDNGRYESSLNSVAFLAEDYIQHIQHHLNQLN
ncbi:DinB family protein [Mucilaginibacter rigui]|uniref:DinB family protein n=1 Tax=Mucilaginibacter rigui TaxID=534635 RepID=A0ABR7X9R0_9SPHI|nr:DinB family protein [Mucilaginibacter rigui]MBD1387308.1 DinB family protein [Mucilaginibacter rigui]